MPVTFQVVGNLADFGNDVRAGVKVRATATPGIKVGDVAVHSNQPEVVVTDAAGAFTLELVSLPGVWYRIQTPYANAINTVNLAGYIPDVGDPTTGTVFPALTVINLKDVVSEDPTPGYEAIAYVGGGGGGGAVDSVNGKTGVVVLDAADVGADPTGTAASLVGALTIPNSPDDIGAATAAQGALADTAVQPADLTAYATDAELATGLATKANTSHTHTSANVTDFTEAVQDALAGFFNVTGATFTYDDANNQLVVTVPPDTNTTDPEAVRDAIGAAMVGVGNIVVTVNDALDTITISTTATVNSTDAALRDRATHTGTQPASTISDSTTTGRALLTAVDATAARTTLGLGTAATTATTAYATAAQGAKADTALQPSTAQAINPQTGTSYTLVAGDAGKVVTLSSAAAITLNAPGSVFTAGQRVDVVVIGTGMATVVGTSGATANGTPSLVSRAQWSAFTILWTSATACVVIGDMA